MFAAAVKDEGDTDEDEHHQLEGGGEDDVFHGVISFQPNLQSDIGFLVLLDVIPQRGADI